MDDSENDKLWETMSEYNFLAVHKVPADLICSICNKLIVDARISPCGCRYCKGCIEEHLSNESEFCPGEKNECEEEELELDANIWIDHVANRRVAKVIVRCPIKMCKYQDTITKIVEHVEICKKQSVKCPYYEFGCDYIIASGDGIGNHMESDKNRHIDQLMVKIREKEEEIESLGNEIVLLKKNLEAKQIQVEGVKKQLTMVNTKLDQIMVNQKYELNQSKLNLDNNLKEIDYLKSKLSCFYSLNIKKFDWSINLSDEKSILSPLLSDEFYTHTDGYKMQLQFSKSSNANYELSAHMVNGTYNQNQRFPVEIDLTVGIVGTNSNEFLKSERQLIVFNDCCSKNLTLKIFSSANKSHSFKVKCIAKIIK